jgi:hypothetical protein
MNLSRNRLYITILLACLAGYVWIYFGIFHGIYQSKYFEVCLIKRITNIPCPSCGTTRSLAAILNGNFEQAFFLNPFGFIVTLIMFIAPFWIIKDLSVKKKSFFDFYKSIEQKSNKPLITILIVSIVLINWVWNITKQL